MILVGKRKVKMQDWLIDFCNRLQGRILNFNASTAHIWGQHMVIWQRKGINPALLDSFIAAVALRHQLTIVTRNTDDFTKLGIRVLNPFNFHSGNGI